VLTRRGPPLDHTANSNTLATSDPGVGVQLYFDDVSDDPDQIARARRAPEAEADLEVLGFEAAGHIRIWLPDAWVAGRVHPELADTVSTIWRSADRTVVVEVELLFGVAFVTFGSLAADGTQLTTVWCEQQGFRGDRYLTPDPAVAAPEPASVSDQKWGGLRGPEEAQLRLDTPSARIHRQRVEGGPLADALARHLERRGVLDTQRWLPLPSTAVGSLLQRALAIGQQAQRLEVALGIRVGAQVLLIGLAFFAVWAHVATAGGSVAGPAVDWAVATGAAWVIGVSFGGAVAMFRGWSSLPWMLLGVLVLPLFLGTWNRWPAWTPTLLAYATVALVAGAIVGYAVDLIVRRITPTGNTSWDGLSGQDVLATYPPSGRSNDLLAPSGNDPLALASRGWTPLGRQVSGSTRSHQEPTTLVPLDGVVEGMVWTEVWQGPDGRTLARVQQVLGHDFVSLVSVTSDGSILETRSLPDPGPGPFLGEETLVDGTTWERGHRWPTRAWLAVASRPSMGLLVKHALSPSHAVEQHVNRVDASSVEEVRSNVVARIRDVEERRAKPETPGWVGWAGVAAMYVVLACMVFDGFREWLLRPFPAEVPYALVGGLYMAGMVGTRVPFGRHAVVLVGLWITTLGVHDPESGAVAYGLYALLVLARLGVPHLYWRHYAGRLRRGEL